jgi:predicted ATPase
MMFVTVTDGSDKKVSRQFTERQSELWQSNLFNNHIDVQVCFLANFNYSLIF